MFLHSWLWLVLLNMNICIGPNPDVDVTWFCPQSVVPGLGTTVGWLEGTSLGRASSPGRSASTSGASTCVEAPSSPPSGSSRLLTVCTGELLDPGPDLGRAGNWSLTTVHDLLWWNSSQTDEDQLVQHEHMTQKNSDVRKGSDFYNSVHSFQFHLFI